MPELNFAETAFAFEDKRNEFEESLSDLCPDRDWVKIGWDWYDCSLEIYEVSPAMRLSKEAWGFIQTSGFLICYVNHTDGWETHYNKNTNIDKPWRRRRKEGVVGFDVNYIPENWGPVKDDWLAGNYITVIPDA